MPPRPLRTQCGCTQRRLDFVLDKKRKFRFFIKKNKNLFVYIKNLLYFCNKFYYKYEKGNYFCSFSAFVISVQ